MAIGDDLFTMLGLIPSRDRAGIPRGTMADEAKASMAANGNAEGRALMDGGARPPAIALPPQMRGGGDITLPDDVPTSFASGSGGGGPAVPPAPQERVVAASPAAAPSPAVKRNSDILLEAYQQQQRQQRLQQLIGGIGQVIAGARGESMQPSGGGGGGGGGIGDLKALLEMRDAETKTIQAAKTKEDIIKQSMITEGWDRKHAEMMYETGNTAKRFDPKEQRERQTIVDTELRKKKLRELAPEIAKARGTELAIIETMIEKDPDAVAKLAENEGITELNIKQNTAAKGRLDNTLAEADAIAWAQHAKDPQSLKDAYPDVEPSRIDEALKSPTAYKKLVEELTTKGGAGPMDPITKDVVDKQLLPAKEKARLMAQANANENREQQELWRKDLKVGSPYTSELMFNISKSWNTMTGQPIPEATKVTEKMMQQQVEGTLSTLKQLGAGTGLSNADREYAAKAQGGFGTTADTLKYLLFAQEKVRNYKIDEHNKEVAKASGYSREIRNREGMFKVEHAKPNRFMREEVEKRFPGYIATVVATGQSLPAAKEYFENNPKTGIGPGVFDHLVKEEMAKQAAAKKG